MTLDEKKETIELNKRNFKVLSKQQKKRNEIVAIIVAASVVLLVLLMFDISNQPKGEYIVETSLYLTISNTDKSSVGLTLIILSSLSISLILSKVANAILNGALP